MPLSFTTADLNKASQLLHGDGVTWEVMFSNIYMAEDRARVMQLIIADRQADLTQELVEQLGNIEHQIRTQD